MGKGAAAPFLSSSLFYIMQIIIQKGHYPKCGPLKDDCGPISVFGFWYGTFDDAIVACSAKAPELLGHEMQMIMKFSIPSAQALTQGIS